MKSCTSLSEEPQEVSDGNFSKIFECFPIDFLFYFLFLENGGSRKAGENGICREHFWDILHEDGQTFDHYCETNYSEIH